MRDRRGFSLVEVLVAICILTFVITLSLIAFAERKSRLRQASEVILAYQALSNEAEYRRRIEFADLNNPLKCPIAFISDTALLKPLEPFGTTVAVVDAKPGVKSVTMTVRWKNGQREAKLALVRADTGGTNLW